MGLTIEFYSAVPQELISLFADDIDAPLDDEHMAVFLQKQQTFPRAVFPPRLLLPDDLNTLCHILNKHHPLVPLRFEDACVKLLWDDGLGTEKLTLLSDQFAHALTECSKSDIEQSALAWASTFPSEEPLSSAPAYQAVLQLQEIARDVIRSKKSLIYHLEGAPQFFDYLRYN